MRVWLWGREVLGIPMVCVCVYVCVCVGRLDIQAGGRQGAFLVVEKNDCEPCQIEEALSWRDITVLW
jgi:hypothetical protein